MSADISSPLLTALDRALVLALREEVRTPSRSTAPVGSVRGAAAPPLPAAPPAPATPETPGQANGATGPAADQLLGELDAVDASVSTQISHVRSWLRAHPELLRLLDEGMRQEFKALERRLKRSGLLQNAVFTALGAVLGLVLPAALAIFHVTLPVVGH